MSQYDWGGKREYLAPNNIGQSELYRTRNRALISDMIAEKQPTDGTHLNSPVENYCIATWLLVNLGLHPLRMGVKNTSAINSAGTKYCRIEELGYGKWRYSF